MGKASSVVIINGCSHCTSTQWHIPFGIGTTKYCTECGAEWDPLPLPHHPTVAAHIVHTATCCACGTPHTNPIYDDGDLCTTCEDRVNGHTI